jgi:SAM-dependent methyltransferase
MAAEVSADLAETNRRFYDDLWSAARLTPPERFNTWPLLNHLGESAEHVLEAGPGLRPRLPLAATVFLESSRPAVARLRRAGARALLGDVQHLPFPDESFAMVGAFDIIEHVLDDESVFAELARVLAPHGSLVFSVPLHSSAWTGFDEMVGHCRRYDPPALERALAKHGLAIVESAVYGMQPKSRWLLDLGVWMMRTNHARAMLWYNRVFMPVSIWLQKPLRFVRGLVDAPEVDEVIAVCRREG